MAWRAEHLSKQKDYLHQVILQIVLRLQKQLYEAV